MLGTEGAWVPTPPFAASPPIVPEKLGPYCADALLSSEDVSEDGAADADGSSCAAPAAEEVLPDVLFPPMLGTCGKRIPPEVS